MQESLSQRKTNIHLNLCHFYQVPHCSLFFIQCLKRIVTPTLSTPSFPICLKHRNLPSKLITAGTAHQSSLPTVHKSHSNFQSTGLYSFFIQLNLFAALIPQYKSYLGRILLFYFLLYPQHVEQCLALSRCSISISRMNELVHSFARLTEESTPRLQGLSTILVLLSCSCVSLFHQYPFCQYPCIWPFPSVSSLSSSTHSTYSL